MKHRIHLSEQQLCTIVCRYQTSDNLNDLLPVVDSLRGLILCIARQRPERGAVQLQDLIQEGILGLFQAAKEFQPQTSDSFTSFARNYISDAIRTFYTANCLPLSRPGRSTAQLSIESIDSYTCNTLDNEGHELTPTLSQQLIYLMPTDDSEQCCKVLQSALHSLSPLERKVIDLSFANEPMDDDRLAQQLHLSLPRLRQIRNQSLRKMRICINNNPICTRQSE